MFHVRIPLKRRVRHASHDRKQNDAVVVRCRLDNGAIGWGEGLPRAYVTGETIDTAWQHLTELDTTALAGRFEDAEGLAALVREIQLPRPSEQRDCFGNAARCALELAILDAGCLSLNSTLSEFMRGLPESAGLTQRVEHVHYSAAITASRMLKVRIRAWLYRYYGFRQCKVKVGVRKNDARLLRIVRRIFGPKVALRIDANEAWHAEEVADKLSRLEKQGIDSVEQPVPHAEVRKLAQVRTQTPVPIMLDESLCSSSDADLAIELGLCDAFNLRLSKCGGVIPTIELAQRARGAGLSYQLGCQVGETGILSAAGRHFATTIAGLTAVEGSFDRFLVREPLTVEDLTFGKAGRAEALTGPGLGITVQQRAVDRVTQRQMTLKVD
ncbi:mandelate racemase/muconate lactonizing enzyme family protein [Planctomicrobium piriforme]|uniref:mandelate racemase/muconate lactonizing enzyme family protein n=1 Tax=Planctomicrobium piriforme TaxID=1576369 RepID=UPI001C31CAEE|nr:enolase C-terminal domain-like protein [Planctomicrobium piriforme]